MKSISFNHSSILTGIISVDSRLNCNHTEHLSVSANSNTSTIHISCTVHQEERYAKFSVLQRWRILTIKRSPCLVPVILNGSRRKISAASVSRFRPLAHHPPSNDGRHISFYWHSWASASSKLTPASAFRHAEF
jgi:hypothetical protein